MMRVATYGAVELLIFLFLSPEELVRKYAVCTDDSGVFSRTLLSKFSTFYTPVQSSHMVTVLSK